MTLHQVTAPPEGIIPAIPPDRAIYLAPVTNDPIRTSWTATSISFSARYIYGKTHIISPLLVLYDPHIGTLYAYHNSRWHHGTPGGLSLNEEIEASYFDMNIR